MEVYLVHSHFDKCHLEEVKAEMAELGTPRIRVIDMGEGLYAAIEGCHRLRAAAALDLTPELDILDYNAIADLDVTDPALCLDLDNPGMTISDLVSNFNRRAWLEFGD